MSFRFYTLDSRLIPILLKFRGNLDQEKYHNSFVGEIAYGRWAISRLRKYLWEVLLNWLCDCNIFREILEYNSSIHQFKGWVKKF